MSQQLCKKLCILSPDLFALSNAYPNPFNPITTIDFSVPFESKVILEGYDISGRNVGVLSNKLYQPGYYSVSWDASKYSSGVYFLRMTSAGYVQSEKLMLIK